MKIYNLSIDTAKPITQKIVVPRDTEKYGIAVTVNKDGEKMDNISCSIDDNGNTITPSKTLSDGASLFVMSSIGSVSRAIEINASTNPLEFEGETKTAHSPIPGLTVSVSWKIKIPAGTYAREDLNLFSLLDSVLPQQIVSGKQYMFNTKLNDGDKSNAYQIVYVAGQGLPIFKDYAYKTLPDDTKLELKQEVEWNYTASMKDGESWTSPNSYIGSAISSTQTIQLDEIKGAYADREIEEPQDFTNVPATNLSVENLSLSGVTHIPIWTSLSIDGVEYIVLAASQANN